jgi:plasmid stabilization system protein ParE
VKRRFAVVITPRAEAELEAAYLWMCENHSPARAFRWRGRVLAAAIKLERLPFLGALVPDGPPEVDVRAVHVAPYRLLYVVEGGRVGVLHIRHSARAPGGIITSGWRGGKRD